MTSEHFHELFRREEWQECERRLIEAAHGHCVNCGASSSLRIHHSYYEKNRLPWDYPHESLHALCEACKREAEERRVELRRQIGRVAYVHSERLLGYAQAMEASDCEMVIPVRSFEHAEGIGDATGVAAETILRRMTAENTISSDVLAELWAEQRPRRIAAIRSGA